MNEQSPDKDDHSGNAQGASQTFRLNEMKSVLEARVKAQPENAEAWRELAQVKMMLGDIDGAENDCIECLRIAPKNASGLVLMGNLLTNYRMDDAAAEKYYVQAVEADPESALAHSNYGTLLFKRGEKFKAVGELRRSIQLDRRQGVARYMLAQCYAAMDDWHSAWVVSDEALRIGEIGFADADNFNRVRDGLLKIRAVAESKGGATPPGRGDKAMEQALRQRDFDQRHAGSDPTVNMMMAMYMLGAMQRFDKMTPEQVKSVATEIAVIGTRGISTAKDANYTLKTIPGEEFSGYRLLANYYVSWKIAFPEHLSKIGLPFDDAYALAQQMYDAKKPGSQ